MVVIVKGRKTEYHGVANAAIASMTDDELAEELRRVEHDLRDWRSRTLGQPRWYARVPEIRAEKNCLQCERRRIEAEMRRRLAEA